MWGDTVQKITGLDVIKFDKDIKTPDDKSTYEFILEQYGQRAVTVIEELLKYPETRK